MREEAHDTGQEDDTQEDNVSPIHIVTDKESFEQGIFLNIERGIGFVSSVAWLVATVLSFIVVVGSGGSILRNGINTNETITFFVFFVALYIAKRVFLEEFEILEEFLR